MSFGPTLAFDERDVALREEIRTWLQSNDITSLPGTDDYARRVAALRAWQGRLAAAGFVGLSWPAAYGGRGLGLAAEAVFAEELAGSGAPELINRLAIYTWGPTLLALGTEAQRQRFLRPMLDASELWCQGFSEPGAGSDLAAVTTVARDDGDTFLVNGQKVWTSRAAWSRWGALLVRTDRSARPHAGLSILIVDMQAPGVTVRPLLQIAHDPHFSEVFLEDVRVPKADVLGAVNDGWRVAMTAMGFERGLFVLERQIRLRKRLDDLARELVGRARGAEAAAAVGRCYARLEVLRARVYATLAGQRDGTLAAGATSVDKLLLTEADQELFHTAFDLLGAEAAFEESSWTHDLLDSRAVSIYSGTSEIQRNIVASQLLRLGRSS